MLPKCAVAVSLLIPTWNTLSAQTWQDRTQVDHGSDHLPNSPPEPGACDPRRGGAVMFRSTGPALWDGATSRRLDPGYPVGYGGRLFVAAACDQDTGLTTTEVSDGTNSSWTAAFDLTQQNLGPYTNWDPVLGRNVPVGLDRTRHGLAWDPVQHTMLAFGGIALGAGQAGNTFLWQTTPRFAWTPITVQPQPSTRLDPLLATDTVRGRIVLFGGRDPSGPAMADTWEWNGQTWTARATAPAGRWAAGFTWDARRHVCVLHGGTDGATTFADTWEWNGSGWTQRASSARPRQGHQLFFDPTREQVLAWGGDSWRSQQGMAAWDGVQWSALPSASPLPRTSMSVATDTHRGRLVLFGGVADGIDRDDTWEWDGVQWLLQQPLHRPPPRTAAAMAYDPLRQRTVVYGGRSSTGYPWHTDTWEWDGHDWTLVAPAFGVPGLVFDVRLAFSPSSGGLVLVNGWYFFPDATWLLDSQGWHQLPITTPPLESGSFAMALHAPTGELVLYGKDAWPTMPQPWSSTYVLQNGAWVLRQAASPPGIRTNPVMVEDPATGDLLLASADEWPATWRWNGSSWSPISGQATFQGGVGAVDPLRRIPVAFDDGMHWFTSTPLTVSGVLGVTGCHGAPGELLLRQLEGLWLGNSAAALVATNAMPGALVAFAAAPPTSSPYPAFQGCRLVPMQWLLGVAIANASGAATVPLPLPFLPALRGLTLDLQGIAIDHASQNGLFAATRIHRVYLGD